MIPVESILEETRRTLSLLRPGESPLMRWFREHLLEPLAEFAARVLGAIARLGLTTPGLVLLVAVVLLAAALLAWLGILLFRRGQEGHRARAEERIERTSSGLRDPAAAEAEAARLAGEGRFVEAVRFLYFAAFLRLHRRSNRPFDPSLTPGENLRPFRSEACFPRLRDFVRRYEAASFGGAGLDEAGYRETAALRPPEAS